MECPHQKLSQLFILISRFATTKDTCSLAQRDVCRLRCVYVITRSTIAMQPSRRREPHGNEDGNPKRRTLQPPTLNPSAVLVFSRCHREVRGGVSRRPDGATGDVPRSSTRRVVNVMRLGCTGPSARFAGASAADISAGTSSRGGQWTR